MTPYQQALAVLQQAYDDADPRARQLCADRIDQAAASGDVELIGKLQSALPAIGALAAAYDAASPETQAAFDERIDAARMSLDAAEIESLTSALLAS